MFHLTYPIYIYIGGETHLWGLAYTITLKVTNTGMHVISLTKAAEKIFTGKKIPHMGDTESLYVITKNLKKVSPPAPKKERTNQM